MIGKKELEEKIVEISKKNEIDFAKWIKSKESKINKIILKAVAEGEQCALFPFIAKKESFLEFSKDFFLDKGYSVNICTGPFTGKIFFIISW